MKETQDEGEHKISKEELIRRYKESLINRNQPHFGEGGWLNKIDKPIIEKKSMVNPNEQVMCPFCLWQAKASKFFISTKKGISEGKANCPNCHNGMLMKTLFADMDAKQYAEWVYNYRRSGFWQKCKFDEWRKRLNGIGWGKEFWLKYKELKGTDDTESAFTDAERMQRDYGIDIHEQRH